MIRVKELPVRLRAMRCLVNHNTGHTKARFADHPKQLAFKALIEVWVAETPKHTSALN